MVKDLDGLTEDERKALRGSKFAPLPPPPKSSLKTQPRLAHPGGPIATNKAAALAKFLERKLQDPDGLASINPALIERAVKNAKDTVKASGSSSSGYVIRHVSSFGDSENLQDSDEEIPRKMKDKASKVKLKGQKLKKKKKKKAKQ
ncbi:uncharacterized protein LOC113354228 isoform X1 [Papaver somniferum]|uniref:uncharacterized protein LOC113354228 isoform X1 n=1 Tax=Papaver somniferum TaxID=3469 RepID=UPI000E6FAA10|nr:uncharacterized protein LOC113354228 isoform X1 [Papaver somniferum]